jgi:hypothetical protein
MAKNVFSIVFLITEERVYTSKPNNVFDTTSHEIDNVQDAHSMNHALPPALLIRAMISQLLRTEHHSLPKGRTFGYYCRNTGGDNRVITT